MPGNPSTPHAAVLASPVGPLGVRIEGGCVRAIDFLPPATPICPPHGALARRVAAQLAAYFDDPHQRFDLPLCAEGTPYRQRVWAAIRAIPPGSTRTYGELARQLGSSPRAVGQAAGDNPLPIVVPCHRVVGRQGLGGFAHASDGHTVDIKRWLLRHEGILRG